MLVLERLPGHLVSDTEGDKDLEELAAKCYESDIDVSIPIKKLRGGKKKATVVLERITRSNKHY